MPDKDVTIFQIGSQPARFSALQSGKIHGVMIAIPLTAAATKMGFNTLADLQMLGLEYQHTGLAVSQNTSKDTAGTGAQYHEGLRGRYSFHEDAPKRSDWSLVQIYQKR